MTLKGSLLRIVGLVTTVLALAAPASQAGPFPTLDTKCPDMPVENPFTQWGDSNDYRLVPGGGFEDDMPLWAPYVVRSVDGNESFNVRDALDSKSLLMPARSMVISQAFCVGKSDAGVRLFTKASNVTKGSKLSVEIIYNDRTNSRLRAARIGYVAPTADWRPTRHIKMFGKRRALGPGTTPVELRFRVIGSARWQIDDVYVESVSG
jgi:hypothetical protein